MPQSLITIRMDENLKQQFDFICNELGMNMTTAITVFAKKVCREQRIPFEISIDKKYNGGFAVEQKIHYQVFVYPECIDAGIKPISNTFDNLEEAIQFLEVESNVMEEEIDASDDFDIRGKCRVHFAIKIFHYDCNQHCVTFDIDGLEYIRNETHIKITPPLQDDPQVIGAAYSFIKALLLNKE